MNSALGKITALIGLAAGATALLQTFSVEPLPSANLVVRCAPPNPMSTMFNFIEELNAYKGEVVYLKMDYDAGCKKWTYPRSISEDGNVVSYEINWVDLARTDGLLDGAPNGNQYAEISRWMEEHFWKKLPTLKLRMINNHSYGAVNPINIELFNALGITVNSKPILNPMVSARFNVEGLFDQASGPFSVSYSKGDGTHGYELTPAFVDDVLRKRVVCTLKDWTKAERFLLCPFL
ncbi:hypothetical protein [Sedimenticola selenatireducens]|uniref:hypothetical protein n=1 Tax=Sedimenticola selenatireducens TaxID=191960 RepID=UPI002AAAE07E|nr:hypothetical protein [Sedimenticola selenatireducens]